MPECSASRVVSSEERVYTLLLDTLAVQYVSLLVHMQREPTGTHAA